MLLGKLLVSKGIITDEQLSEALDYQKTNGGLLGIVLLNLNHITEKQLIELLLIQEKLKGNL